MLTSAPGMPAGTNRERAAQGMSVFATLLSVLPLQPDALGCGPCYSFWPCFGALT